MMCRQFCFGRVCFGMACVLGILSCQFVFAAGPIFDPLTSFDSANYTVSAADPVVYDAAGAHFGTGIAGDGGRSYQRTMIRGFANVSFVAEITFETTTDDQAVFIGLGAGDMALFGTPDWSTQFSSASFWAETANDKFVRFRTANDVNTFGDTPVTGGLDPGTHRFRMTFDKSTAQLLGEIDKNYAGGPFVADAVTSNFPIVTTSLYGPDGWPTEPSRIFFGGDDGATFRDLSINYVPEPATAAILLLSFATMFCGRVR
jgi:hypothetical protein